MERATNMKLLIRRDNAFKLFRGINSAILSTYLRLKAEFTSSPPPSSEIINSLKVPTGTLSSGKPLFMKPSLRRSAKSWR